MFGGLFLENVVKIDFLMTYYGYAHFTDKIIHSPIDRTAFSTQLAGFSREWKEMGFGESN